MTSKSNAVVNEEFDILANECRTNLEIFRKRVNDLTKNQLKRVLIGLTEMPIETSVTLNSKEEVELFGLGAKIKQDLTNMTINYLKHEGNPKQVIKNEFNLNTEEVTNG